MRFKNIIGLFFLWVAEEKIRWLMKRKGMQVRAVEMTGPAGERCTVDTWGRVHWDDE